MTPPEKDQPMTREMCDLKHEAIDGKIGDLRDDVRRIYEKIDKAQWVTITTLLAAVGGLAVSLFNLITRTAG